MVTPEAAREEQLIEFSPKMLEILGLQHGLPVGAFREITGATQRHYDQWTAEILQDPKVIEALEGAETIVELGCGAHAATTRIIAERLGHAGFPLRSAVLLDINSTIARIAEESVRGAGIQDVTFQCVDFRTPEGLGEIQKLGGEKNIVVARALLNQVGRGVDMMIGRVFPNFGKGVVLDLAHPQENPEAWKFTAVDSNDLQAQKAARVAEKLTDTLYDLLRTDERQLLGSQLKARLESTGLNVVHHQVVPKDPLREPVTDIGFAAVPRTIAAVVAYNIASRGENLPVDLQEFGQLLEAYDDFLMLLQEGRIEVSAIQFGGAVWNGRG